MSRWCVMCKNGCSPIIYIRVISLEQKLIDSSLTFKPIEILYQCLVGVYIFQLKVVCHVQEWLLSHASCNKLSPLYEYLRQNKLGLIEGTFQREGSLYLACNDRNAFFTSKKKLKISSMVVSKCM